MTNHLKKLIILLLVLSCIIKLEAQVPFTRGVNLTNWFQAGSARQIQFTKYTKQDFVRIKGLGCDVIRLPINLHFMTNGAPDYTVDPIFFDFMDQVVDWAEELQIHLLLDNHTFDPNTNTDPSVETILLKIWFQVADHFKNRSNYLYYEVLNEPHGITTAVWCQIQQKVINAIRTVDTRHTIIVGASGFNSYNELNNMPIYTDTNLIYTFHFYDPFMFTHQGATWTDNMQDLAGIPFPYDAARMPATPASAKGTWVESSLNNYKNDGTVAKVKQLIDVAASFKTSRNVRLFCGEFGVYIPNSPHADRVYWYDVVRKYLEDKGIIWTIWDYQGGFGLFEKGSSELFDYDLDVEILKSLNFIIPEQKDFVLLPEMKPFSIYSDYIGASVFESGYAGNGTIDYYSSSAQIGKYSIYWTGSNQYAGPGFSFKPTKDLSKLVDNNYALDFWVKGDSPNIKFQIRFLDTKSTVAGDHPWRISYTIDQTKATWNETWQHVVIPLKSFKETGSWDNNTWYNPEGKFDWKAVDRFEIISEYGALGTQKIGFDEIMVNGTPITGIDALKATADQIIKAWPNPFTKTVTINYLLDKSDQVELSIFDLTGRKLETLIHSFQNAGRHQITWTPLQNRSVKLPGGIYLCKIATTEKTEVVKLIRKAE
jgi:endoglucanase